jgi:hypothetical protein
LKIIDTNIGEISFGSKSILEYEMTGGCLLNIKCPAPWQENPITGSFSLDNTVFLPRKSKNKSEASFLDGPQPYRNLRAHLMNLQNNQTANLVHSLELAVERETESGWFNKLLSWLYEKFSDYGSSTLRPTACFFGILVFSWVLGFIDGGGSPALGLEEYTGWRSVLLQENLCGRTMRAIVLGSQSVVNPLGIFGSKNLLVPNHIWLASFSVILGLFSAIFIALFIFAIRRRFKIPT